MKAFITFNDCKFQNTSDGTTGDYIKLYDFINTHRGNKVNRVADIPVKKIFNSTFMSHAIVQLLNIEWYDDVSALPAMSVVRFSDNLINVQSNVVYLYQIDEHNKLLIHNKALVLNNVSFGEVHMGFCGDSHVLDSILAQIDIKYDIEQTVD